MNSNTMFMKRKSWLIPAMLAFTFVGLSVANADITVLEIEDGTITMEATQVSLVEVAQAISEQSDLEITASEGLDQLVDISIFNTPIIPAMAKISPNHMLVQKKVAGKTVVSGVTFILDYGQTGGSDFNLPTGEPADEIAQEEMPNDEYVEPVSVEETIGMDPAGQEEQPSEQPLQ